MSGVTTLSFWQLFLVTLGPAALTACVAFVAPFLLEKRKQEAEKKKRREDKLEEFIEVLYQHEHWLDEKKNARVFGEKTVLGVTPLSRIQAIASIYFNQFKAGIENVAKQAQGYELWMAEAGKKRLNGEADYTAGFPGAYLPYQSSLTELLESIRVYAQKEFK
jgi:hypothetical protein